MCGKPNAEEAETCLYCQARLKPVGPGAAPGGDAEPVAAGGEPAPDWLSRLRDQGSPMPGGTRELSGEPESPTDKEASDWLSRIRTRADDESPSPSGATSPAEDVFGRGKPAEPSGPSPAFAPSAGEGVPASAATPLAEPASEEDEPEWLKRLRARRAVEGTPGAAPAPSFPAPQATGEGLPPDWMHAPHEDLATGPTAAASPQPAGSEGGMPSWLSDVQPPAPRPTPVENVPPAAPATPAAFASEDDELRGAYSEKEIPDWLVSAREEAAAPVAGLAGGPEAPTETPPLEELLAPGVLPEWLTAGSSPTPPPMEALGAGLEQAVLPPWLRAMRPVEGPLAPKGEAGEAEERVESAGPLAGLRGVLPPKVEAEVGRHPPVLPSVLDIQPAHAAHAELLQRIISTPESRAVPRARRRPQARPWGGLVVLVILVAAMIVPGLTGTSVFARPSVVAVETLQTANLINSLPLDRPLLLAVDYDAAASAELEAAALAVLDHVMTIGAPIASVSTRPVGPALAERLMARTRAAHPQYQAGINYLPLGYLPAGPIGLRAFAANPWQAVYAQSAPESWDAGLVAALHASSNFSAILVVASDPAVLQTWIEQVHTAVPSVPLVAIVSAAAEPLARPYYESAFPSVQGMVVGLAGAEAYECLNALDPASGRCGRPGVADSMWDPFGMAVLGAVLILLVGGLASVIRRGVISMRRTSHE
ncbi:MAG: hypothetical protein A2Z30_03165 [Chloroflexi bacterium RBG_16_64_43]|nr:MAG: hypothetical protein A2Z30_03165 [Chloroflexi bacterium RBG_16_64_43]